MGKAASSGKRRPSGRGTVREWRKPRAGDVWTTSADGWAFVPDNVDFTWRPYTLGQWQWIEPYGWTWVSYERFGWATRIECRLDTGRTHQIRVHLTSIGHPLIGDPVYKGKRPAAPIAELALQRQALHAMKLELDHPVSGERMRWHSRLPAEHIATHFGIAWMISA